MLLIVVGQITDIVIGKRCFTTALGMPNDAVFYPGIQFVFNCFSSKELWIPHQMFFQMGDTIFICPFYISDCIFQES